MRSVSRTVFALGWRAAPGWVLYTAALLVGAAVAWLLYPLGFALVIDAALGIVRVAEANMPGFSQPHGFVELPQIENPAGDEKIAQRTVGGRQGLHRIPIRPPPRRGGDRFAAARTAGRR